MIRPPAEIHFYVKIRGEWRYLYRAVGKEGNTVDFLLRARWNKAAAQRYLEKSIRQNGVPETVTIDKSGANLAALRAVNAGRDTPIKIRQVEIMHMIAKGQMKHTGKLRPSAACQFYSLVT